MIKEGLYTFTDKEVAEKYAEKLNGVLVHNLIPFDGEWFDVWFLWYKYEEEENENENK